jgi:hypothetical protein
MQGRRKSPLRFFARVGTGVPPVQAERSSAVVGSYDKRWAGMSWARIK